MCGRFTLKGPPNQIAEMLGLATVPNLAPRYNIAPTQDVLALRPQADGDRQLAWLRWGLIPFWAKDMMIGAKMINARADTVAEKPAFRQAYRSRRCLIPADGFYEWKTLARGRKQPYRIHRPDEAPFVFAGLWERWEKGEQPVESCTIVTTDAPADLAAIHHRVPVILEGDALQAWLDTPAQEADGLLDLLAPLAEGTLVADPVSTTVNNVRNDGPECLEPAELEEVEPEEPTPRKANQGDLFG
ncbi:MAG: SOS response-associated peptidase [Proteobacteria bacterium]|nr:SOS response-associated peptidase [Pseudomonadota bacterium]MDA0952964.1 SOS response-associated peptidase [Pseudomonadota bacterium]